MAARAPADVHGRGGVHPLLSHPAPARQPGLDLATGRGGGSEPPPYLFRIQIHNLDELAPARVPRDDANPIALQREHLGEHVDERLVRTTAFGWRGDAHLPPVAVPS